MRRLAVRVGQTRRKPDLDRQHAVRIAVREDVHDAVERAPELDGLRVRFEMPRLELGDDELALDQRQQAVRRLVGLLEQRAAALRVDRRVPLQDARERRLHRGRRASHLVADGAQHQVLGLEREALRRHILVQRQDA